MNELMYLKAVDNGLAIINIIQIANRGLTSNKY